ncbi:MAG: hypothetical protein Pg6A_07040 [Termitinemataceae bacterium]|nr:MAG: hypothetical protein Pg6A_07040 [Termitinemataceae bacterium]
MNKRFFTILLLFAVLLSAHAQEDAASTPEAAAASELPNSFRQFSIGMNIDSLKTALKDDSLFVFRGDQDVSYLPVTEQNLVESAGSSYIKRAFFQLKDNAVFIMAFTMNTELIDHYSIFMSFVKKYGQPSVLNPKEAIWESESVRISIERPLVVKYIDKKVFNTLIDNSEALNSKKSEIRDSFLENF